MKKNIDLVIDGIAPEKVMYDTDNHSLVVLYPAQKEFKRGDKVRLNKDLNLKLGKWYNGLVYIKEIDNVKDAILTIDRVSESNGNIKAYNNIDGGWWWYSPEWLEHIVEDEVKFKRGDILASDNTLMIFDKYEFNQENDLFYSLWNNMGIYNRTWTSKSFTHATDEQKAQVHELLKKDGKKWNAETLQVEDLDISEIVVDLVSACEYLGIKRPSFFILDACERSEKFEAQITLQLIREAWNKFDEFEVDYANSEQDIYFPVLDAYGYIGYLVSRSYLHINNSCYSFKTKARALQFGTQFKELFKTAMGI